MPGSSHSPWSLKAILVSLLAVIAALVWYQQGRFDPNDWMYRPGPGPGQPASETIAAVSGLSAMGPAESFAPQQLADKIDGKAELYLSAGCAGLQTRRFRLDQMPTLWLEVFVYRMTSWRGAFSVYSAQRRQPKSPLELTADGYKSANGMFLVHGPYYMELIASSDQTEIMAAARQLTREFVLRHPVSDATGDDRSLLPDAHRVDDSIGLTAANTFGVEGLDWIFSAEYRLNGQTATVFVSRRQDAETSRHLVKAYVEFLHQYGATTEASASVPGQAVFMQVFDVYELVGHHGPYLYGVHEASDAGFATDLAKRALRRMKGRQP